MFWTIAVGTGVAFSRGQDKMKETSFAGFVFNQGGTGENSTTSKYGYEGLSGVTVNALNPKVETEEEDKHKFETKTDDKGYYQFDDLPDGDYSGHL